MLLCLPLDRLRGASLQLWRLSALKRAIWTSFFLAASPAEGPRLRRLVDLHWRVRVCCEWKDHGRLWRRTFRWVAEDKWRITQLPTEAGWITTGTRFDSDRSHKCTKAIGCRLEDSAVRMCRILVGRASEQRSLFSSRSQACKTLLSDGRWCFDWQRSEIYRSADRLPRASESILRLLQSPAFGSRRGLLTPCCRPKLR